MTKEELEIDNKRLDFNEKVQKVQLVVKKEELKEQDVRLNKLCFDYQERERQIEKLETENNKLLDVINNQDVKIADLEKQIEKMKNWCNCKNYQQCLIELAEQGKGMKPSECCVNCKKWEIEENE